MCHGRCPHATEGGGHRWNVCPHLHPHPNRGLSSIRGCMPRAAQEHGPRGTMFWKGPAGLAGLSPSYRVLLILLLTGLVPQFPPLGHSTNIPLHGQEGHHSSENAGSHDRRGKRPNPSPLMSPGHRQSLPVREGCRGAPDP